MCFRLCVRGMLRSSVFPLALSSTASAAAQAALFGSFVSTMRLCDFPCPSIIGVRPWTFRCVRPLAEVTGSPGFRSRCLRTCRAGPKASRDTDASSFAFRLVQQRRHSELPSLARWWFNFAAQYLACTLPVNASPSPLRMKVHDPEKTVMRVLPPVPDSAMITSEVGS